MYNHTLVQELFNKGNIWDGIQVAKRYIKENGVKNSQLEIFLIAKGMYAVGQLTDALFWIKQTNADPIVRIPLQETIRTVVWM